MARSGRSRSAFPEGLVTTVGPGTTLALALTPAEAAEHIVLHLERKGYIDADGN